MTGKIEQKPIDMKNLRVYNHVQFNAQTRRELN